MSGLLVWKHLIELVGSSWTAAVLSDQFLHSLTCYTHGTESLFESVAESTRLPVKFDTPMTMVNADFTKLLTVNLAVSK